MAGLTTEETAWLERYKRELAERIMKRMAVYLLAQGVDVNAPPNDMPRRGSELQITIGDNS